LFRGTVLGREAGGLGSLPSTISMLSKFFFFWILILSGVTKSANCLRPQFVNYGWIFLVLIVHTSSAISRTTSISMWETWLVQLSLLIVDMVLWCHSCSNLTHPNQSMTRPPTPPNSLSPTRSALENSVTANPFTLISPWLVRCFFSPFSQSNHLNPHERLPRVQEANPSPRTSLLLQTRHHSHPIYHWHKTEPTQCSSHHPEESFSIGNSGQFAHLY